MTNCAELHLFLMDEGVNGASRRPKTTKRLQPLG